MQEATRELRAPQAQGESERRQEFPGAADTPEMAVGFELRQQAPRGVYAAGGKRAFDVVVGGVLAVLALPVIALLAVGSLLGLGSWPIFVQRRIGFRGRPFRCPKIRTLPRGTAKTLDKYALAGVATNAYCRFLRRTHLDELPQLLLVPFGRMSLVGPRPEMPELAERYPPDFWELRTRVRPGCTGLWQLSDDAQALIFEAPEYDRSYVERCSFWLDVRILGRTVRSLLPGTPKVDDLATVKRLTRSG